LKHVYNGFLYQVRCFQKRLRTFLN